MAKLLTKSNRVVLGNSGRVIITDDPADCECCGEFVPCTNQSCPNGFTDAQGNPQPSPLVGCTRNARNISNTCLLLTASMQGSDSPPYVSSADGGDIDPRLFMSESWSGSVTQCYDPNGSFSNCCSAEAALASPLLGNYPIPAFFFETGHLQFTISASATTNGSVSFSAFMQTRTRPTGAQGLGVEQYSTRAFGTLTTITPQGPQASPPKFWHTPIHTGPNDTNSFTGSMVPIFQAGANGVGQVVGAEVTWSSVSTGTTFSTGISTPLPYVTSFSGSATIRLLNLLRYDPNCQDGFALRAPSDPRLANLTPEASFKGGCCG